MRRLITMDRANHVGVNYGNTVALVHIPYEVRIMPKVTSIDKARSSKIRRAADRHSSQGFIPCSQDMTICGDCEGNRAKEKCPRLKEWRAKKE